jgi:hypothetical protein
MTSFRGSRKHMLDWLDSPSFRAELNELLSPSGAVVGPEDEWMPRGSEQPQEARLDTFGPRHLPDFPHWREVRDWWLVHHRGANTPNWDMAATCTLGNRCGLMLLEAKANVEELKADGKALSPTASQHSKDNHSRIGDAIDEARAALLPQWPALAISRDTHYQLSNRVAFAWRLASLGLPVVLVYFGFLGDQGIRDAGEPFTSDQHWQDAFWDHAGSVLPKTMCEQPVDCGAAPFWFLSRSREVISQSALRGHSAHWRAWRFDWLRVGG